MLCPLHGFVWRQQLGDYLEKYQAWSSYRPEEQGVLIAYASVYGNTENAAEILATALRERGVKTVMYDVSVTPASEIIAGCFRYSHLVFAATTYNAGIFISMEELLRDLVAHNIQNRTVALIENGTWAATSGRLMRQLLDECKNMTFLGETVSLKSSLKAPGYAQLQALADTITATLPQTTAPQPHAAATIEKAAYSEADLRPVCPDCPAGWEGQRLHHQYCPAADRRRRAALR